MQCIKCGRETAQNHVFCDTCLEVMDKSPVKPGTPVVIPKRPRKIHPAAAAKKEKPEDQIPRLEKLIRTLCWMCLVLFVALSICVGIIVWHFTSTDHGGLAIGQNYSTEAPDNAPLSR